MLRADDLMKMHHDGRANALESRERFDQTPACFATGACDEDHVSSKNYVTASAFCEAVSS